jgi:hypothetical protein
MQNENRMNPERVRQPPNPFRVENYFLSHPQGWSVRDNPGVCKNENRMNPERVRQPPNPFRVENYFLSHPQGCRLRSNPGLKLANAFGVKSNAELFRMPAGVN